MYWSRIEGIREHTEILKRASDFSEASDLTIGVTRTSRILSEVDRGLTIPRAIVSAYPLGHLT